MEVSKFKFMPGFPIWSRVFIIFLTTGISRWLRVSILLFFGISLVEGEGVHFQDKIIDDNPMTLVVVTGTTARLPCSVDPKYTEQYSEHFKVMWVSPRETPISMQDRRIINDQRISIERPLLKDWDLFIRNVSLTDAGTYKCQINTHPVRTKEITLKVKAPPRIIDHSLPLTIEKPEGEKVELFCNATGSPHPNITWHRLHMNGNGVRERVGNVGESLVIHNITRVCGDTYECVADNGVSPVVSQAFKVTVRYAPEVTLPNSRLGQKYGGETILECDVVASPLGVAVWKKNGRIIANTENRELTLYNPNPTEGIVLSLRIRAVMDDDFGLYECEASNVLGTVSDTMELYELRSKKKTTAIPATTSSMTSRRPKWHKNSHSKDIVDVNSSGGGRGREDSQVWNNGDNKWDSYYSNKGPYGGDDSPSAGRSSHTGANPQTGVRTDGNAASKLAQLHSTSIVWMWALTHIVLSRGLFHFVMR